MDSVPFPDEVLVFFQDWKDKSRNFRILVIGDCGSGKTTLVSQLLGKDIALDRNTTNISTHQGDFQGVPVTLHETSGMENTAKGYAEYKRSMCSLLCGGELDVIIYCIKATETRMRESLSHSLQEYRDMGLDWRKTVIALTFANNISASKKDKEVATFNKAEHFNKHVAELTNEIEKVLIGVAECPLFAPATDDAEETLLSKEQWYKPFWSCVLTCVNRASVRREAEVVTFDSEVPLNKQAETVPTDVQTHPPDNKTCRCTCLDNCKCCPPLDNWKDYLCCCCANRHNQKCAIL